MNPVNWTLLQNSLLVAALATLSSTTLGFAVALFLCATGKGLRGVFLVVAAVALALPPFLVTNCWMDLLGLTGRWRGWLPLDIYSLGGTTLILSLLLWPISTFLVLGAWQRVEPAQLEGEPALVGWPLVRWLLLPMARAALAQSAVLTFVLALNNFAVPALLQVKVFPAEVWVRFNTNLNAGAAFRMSWPLIVAPLILLCLWRQQNISWPRLEGAAPGRAFRRQLGPLGVVVTAILTLVVALLSVGLPLGELVADERTWRELIPAVRAGAGAIVSSVLFASGAATLTVFIGLLTWRWPIRTVSWLPFFTPGVLLGIGMIFLFNRPVLSVIYHGAGIVFLAWTIRYLAIGWNGAAHAMRSVDPDLTEAARLEGASGWQIFRHVCWPQVGPLLGAAWFVTYLLCLWDVETILPIVPPGGETLALRIFNFLHYGHNAQVNALCLVLLALAAAPLLAFLVSEAGRVLWANISPPATQRISSAPAPSAGGVGRARGHALERRDESPHPGPLPFSQRYLSSAPTQNWSGARDLSRRSAGKVRPPQWHWLCLCYGGRAEPRWKISRPRRQPTFLRTKVRAPFARPAITLNSYSQRGTGTAGNVISPAARFLRGCLTALMLAGLLGGGCSPSPENDVSIKSEVFSRVQVIGSRGAGLGQFNKPRSLTVDALDNLYVVDMTGRVQKFSPDGSFLSYWQMEQTDKGKPKGMCRDEKGNIVVIEPHYSRVNHFAPDGRLVVQWGTHGTNAGELSFPRDAVVTSRGDIVVSEYGITERVQRFTSEGRGFIDSFGRAGTGDGEFNRPEGLGVDAADRLYVADSCNHRIQVFSPTGQFLRAYGKAGAGRGEFSYPYDICVDAAGRQYVCEFGNSRVQVFDANDRPLEILGGPGAAPGRFSNPWSIALDSKGNLYVADSMNHRVQKFIRREGAGAAVGQPLSGQRAVVRGRSPADFEQ